MIMKYLKVLTPLESVKILNHKMDQIDFFYELTDKDEIYLLVSNDERFVLDYDYDGSWFVWDKKTHHYPFKDIEMNNGKIVAHCKAAKVEKKIIGSINYYRTKIKDLIVYDSPKDDVGEIFKKDVAPQFVEEGENDGR